MTTNSIIKIISEIGSDFRLDICVIFLFRNYNQIYRCCLFAIIHVRIRIHRYFLRVIRIITLLFLTIILIQKYVLLTFISLFVKINSLIKWSIRCIIKFIYYKITKVSFTESHISKSKINS